MDTKEKLQWRTALAMLPRSGWMTAALLMAGSYFSLCVESLQPENMVLPLILTVAAGALLRERLHHEQTVHPGQTEALLLWGLTERDVKKIYRLRFLMLTLLSSVPALLLAALTGSINGSGLALGGGFLAVQLGLSMAAVEDNVKVGRTDYPAQSHKKGVRLMSGSMYMILAAAMMISALAVVR